MFALVWMLAAAVAALAVTVDMRRLVIHRLGLTRTGWMLACAVGAPFAVALYLLLRYSATRKLIESAWTIVGDDSQPLGVRRERLIALRRAGLIGAPIYRACLRALEVGRSPPWRA